MSNIEHLKKVDNIRIKSLRLNELCTTLDGTIVLKDTTNERYALNRDKTPNKLAKANYPILGTSNNGKFSLIKYGLYLIIWNNKKNEPSRATSVYFKENNSFGIDNSGRFIAEIQKKPAREQSQIYVYDTTNLKTLLNQPFTMATFYNLYTTTKSLLKQYLCDMASHTTKTINSFAFGNKRLYLALGLHNGFIEILKCDHANSDWSADKKISLNHDEPVTHIKFTSNDDHLVAAVGEKLFIVDVKKECVLDTRNTKYPILSILVNSNELWRSIIGTLSHKVNKHTSEKENEIIFYRFRSNDEILQNALRKFKKYTDILIKNNNH